MVVYRITKSKYADRLVASGGAARWNNRGSYVIYTAVSRALACLENIVHRTGEGFLDDYRVMVIEIPNEIVIKKISLDHLSAHWFDFENQYKTQEVGGRWLVGKESAVLQVPSAIIPHECNYLLNPAHDQFPLIRLLRTEPFHFDPRI